MARRAKNLLQKPFGEYNLDDIINAASIDQSTLMTEFLMKHDKKITGLDETEFIPWAPASWDTTKPIIASGIIEIDDLSWLTGAGKRTLQTECKKRSPLLDVEDVYRPPVRAKLKVKVRFTMGPSPATFMNGSKHEGSFLKIYWSSKRCSHTVPFIVTQMAAQTYVRSCNFFQRYRIVSFMIYIKESDPMTPIENRDIDYFVQKYLDLRNDDDEESYLFRSSLDEDAPPNAPRPGHHRHIHPAEIKVIFGLQADWLLAQALESWNGGKGKFLDVPKWVEFCRKVRRKRRSAEGLGWGGFHQKEDEDEGPIDADARYLAKYGADEDYWEEKLRARLNAAAQKVRAPKQNDVRPANQIRPAKMRYDPAYSDESSEDDSGSDCDDHPDPDLSSRIHPKTIAEPSLPIGKRWHCPVPRCKRVITLEQLREIARAEYNANFSRNAAWPELRMPFLAEVRKHYHHHWYNAGVGVRVVSRYPDQSAKRTELYFTGKGRPYQPPPKPSGHGLKEEET